MTNHSDEKEAIRRAAMEPHMGGAPRDDLTPDERAISGLLSWSVHPDEQARAVTALLRELGWTGPPDSTSGGSGS